MSHPILETICLFLAILYSSVNFSRARFGQDIPAINFVWMALGVTGFIVLQFLAR